MPSRSHKEVSTRQPEDNGYLSWIKAQFAVKRNIKIGRKNPQYYEVIDGLTPGEQVIVSDYTIFGNNDKVELR